jgi:hypothetical protein
MRYAILTAVCMKAIVLWDVTSYYQHLGEPAVFLKMKTACCFETSIPISQNTVIHVPEGCSIDI